MIETKISSDDARSLARSTVESCVAAAQQAYEDAKISGLCDEGAWEVAIGAIRSVNVDRIVEMHVAGRSESANGCGDGAA